MADMLHFQQAERVAARVIDGVAFVVAVDAQLLVELNEVGTFVWERLVEPATVESLARGVAGAFDVSEGAARDDVRLFLTQMMERGFVTAART